MSTYGKFSPSPERYGGLGARKANDLKSISDSLGRARGTAYDSSLGTTVEVENHGIARAIWEVWETNARLSHTADPYRITGAVLARWERILGLSSEPTATENERRRPIQELFARIGEPTDQQTVADILAEKLGPVFVALHHLALAEAVVWWPGGTPNPEAPWYSTVSHIVIQTVRPYGYTEGQFYEAVARVNEFLDPLMPSDKTWDWYRNGPGHTGVWVTDPGAGFFLDDAVNLDNQIFDV